MNMLYKEVSFEKKILQRLFWGHKSWRFFLVFLGFCSVGIVDSPNLSEI